MEQEEVAAHVARQLSRRRSDLGLSLAEVAARCGVSLQQIHRYEIGANTLSVAMLWRLSRCLGVSIQYFFEGLEEASTAASQTAHPGSSPPSG